MTKSCETLVDDNGVEILVGYCYQKDKGHYEEPGNPDTFVEPLVYTELNSVEVVIKGQGVEILHRLTEKQKDWIIENLTYQD